MRIEMLILWRKVITNTTVCTLALIFACRENGYTQLSNYNKDTAWVSEMINRGRQQRKNNMDSALHLFNEALLRSEAISYKDGIGHTLGNIGLLYAIYNHLDSGMHYYLQAIPYYQNSTRYKHLVPATYSNIGYCFFQNAEYYKAITYFDSSLQEGLKLNLPKERKHLAITLNNLAAIHIRLNQFEKALKFLEQAEEICRSGGFPVQMGITLQNKATLCEKLNDNEKAEYYYKQSIELSANNNNDIDAIVNLLSGKSGLSALKLKQNKPEEALQLLNEVENIDKVFYKEYSSITPAYLKGTAYLQLKDYDSAERFLLKALKESMSINTIDGQQDIHKALAQVYDSTGQYKKALAHFYIYEQLKDSLLGKEKTRDINEIDTRYRTAEKDRQLAIAQKNATEKNMLIGVTSGGIVILSGLLFILYRQSKQKQKIYGQQEEINRLKAMMKGEEKERARIAEELHDGIGGMLAALKMNISNLSTSADNESNSKTLKTTLALVEETAQEVRRTSHNLIPAILEIHSLEEALALYCDNIRRTTGINLSLQVHGAIEGLPKQAELLLYRMVQELVQNVVKHAHATLAYIQLSGYDNTIHIAVEDNGGGIDTDNLHNGVGLYNLQYKVAALGGAMSVDSSEGKNTVVVIEFDLDKLKLVV